MSSTDQDDDVVLARLGAALGLRGEVRLTVRTDDENRLAPGTKVRTDPPAAGPLTIARLRRTGAGYVIAFAEIADRTAAEALRGVELVAEPRVDDDAWYPRELVGLEAVTPDGHVLGEVVAVEHPPAHDVLVVVEPSGAHALVPFVTALVPSVDVAAGRVVVDPPGGLFIDHPAGAADLDDDD
ncbi:16S rRNA processing protein RimM [Beutenbergia cavernae DSM 12333]|uniref:Ribosome maturation factor RimM n=1 Tax=Beutenbergia cavernae (strain ATCC BAA-8 / DSM 12333 / CCUG 43141 / JCM 11478 / NBRC 16432 / NCIMB 13614 / HKI 0122) TaxID=471853 RepID=C5BWW9_BEUC1|nr:ribosome maturation factor RimM [Beutenbergia cavernae]ACQ80785.1 16S rRNA processing protein RimM [Beutenbergia cavernae DSM 12333]